MSVPTDNNISVKEYNKVNKYKDLEIEIDKLWQLKSTTLPALVGALSKGQINTLKIFWQTNPI